MKKVIGVILLFLVVLSGCVDAKKNAYDLSKTKFEEELASYGGNIQFPSQSEVSFTEEDVPEYDSNYNIIGSVKGLVVETRYVGMFLDITITCYVPDGAKSKDDIYCDFAGW